MKRNAIRKEFYMEIRTSLNRFFSIFLIVALGVAFFAGLRATQPDMRLTGDHYYDSSKLMDIRVLSTLGMTKDDVAAISQVDGVSEVEPAFSAHAICDISGYEVVVEVMSATEKLNKIVVSEGRMPSQPDEVLVDDFFITSTGHKIGDKISLSSGTDVPITDTLRAEEFTIVGIGSSSYYMSYQRGTAGIGNGDVNSFVVVLPEVFKQKVYSTVYVAAGGAREMTVYTEEYDHRVDEVLNNVKAIAQDRCQKRYAELYDPAKREIDDAKAELTASREKAEDEYKTRLTNLQYAGLNEAQLRAAAMQLEEGRKKAQTEFDHAEKKIAASEAELAKLEAPEWYVLDRDSIEAYVEFGQNADRIGAIGEVFPVIFFLVAALISLTTMTRMVEEERTAIGTMKALGYSKGAIAMKYLLYAFLATLGGSIFGAAVGLKVLPTVIINAYKMLYRSLPSPITPFNLYYAGLAAFLALLCVEFATFFSCSRELHAGPAELMRPEAPKIGKRVFMERLPFLWKHLSFTWKATVRNLMRYKKRFYMTVFGIGGCMALLLVGYGLKDSIFIIYTRQFDEILTYDASVSIDSKAAVDQIDALETELKNISAIHEVADVRNISVEITKDSRTKSLTMFVPKDNGSFEHFVAFRERVGHRRLVLDDSGVLLTEQFAKSLGIKVGDTILLKEGEKQATVEVAGITENYLSHYVYMSSKLYEELYGVKPIYNERFLLMPGAKEQEALEAGNTILEQPAAAGVFYISYYEDMLSNILDSLNIVVWVLIISAGALAFIVLYNLNNINITERRRELATIKVLGFYDNEMAAYVYRENIILTIIGAIFGVVFGILLHRYVITTVEVDLIMFGRNINPGSFVCSTLLTILFSALVNFVMFFKLKKINMVESLKSIE